MITINIEEDWLHKIDGASVAEAVEYLRGLDPEHTLQFCLTGDTQGVDLSSRLEYRREETPEEVKAAKVWWITKEVAVYTRALAAHIRNHNAAGIERCDGKIKQLNDQMEELK